MSLPPMDGATMCSRGTRRIRESIRRVARHRDRRRWDVPAGSGPALAIHAGEERGDVGAVGALHRVVREHVAHPPRTLDRGGAMARRVVDERELELDGGDLAL